MIGEARRQTSELGKLTGPADSSVSKSLLANCKGLGLISQNSHFEVADIGACIYNPSSLNG